MQFSSDAKVAEQQMHAVIFYLTAFGFIDGDFDSSERKFVRDHIERLVRMRAEAVRTAALDDEAMEETVRRFTAHFHGVFESIEKKITDLLTEPVAHEEDQDSFVRTVLKVRCFEIFKSFDRRGQEALMGALDDLIFADGYAHPAELKFRGELASLLQSDIDFDLADEGSIPPSVRIEIPAAPRSDGGDHAVFSPTELHYSSDPDRIAQQVDDDLKLMDRVREILEHQRCKGVGRLFGKRTVADIAEGQSFLDEYTYVVRPPPGKSYDLTVLGDLHGCYSVLKATVLQSRFLDKVAAYRASPTTVPEPKLIFLGDYIDRGIFSMNGVLRAVMSLFLEAPEHVVILRGNHEYFIEYKGNVYGGVKPSEAISSLKPHVHTNVFRKYGRFFDELPNVLLFDRAFFVHGGIPKDRTLKEKWVDLSSLNDPELRFQMMWSDPSSAEVVPADLQDRSSRFAFGRLQARAFLQRVGCHTIFRGHEKVESGFVPTYDDDAIKLFTLFSSGGATNADLPEDSSYRSVTPMALSVRVDTPKTSTPEGSVFTVTPWAPDWRAYNDPVRNGFFRYPMEIAHLVD